MFNRKNVPLIVAVAIPILMIIFVAASIYLPGLFMNPKYNFLYLSGDNYSTRYYIKDDKLLKQEQDVLYLSIRETKIYFYHTELSKSEEISFEEAQKFKLNSNNLSPDGYSVVPGSSSGGIFPLFFYSGDDYNSVYLKGNNASKKLNINTVGNYYSGFTFLGWVVN